MEKKGKSGDENANCDCEILYLPPSDAFLCSSRNDKYKYMNSINRSVYIFVENKHWYLCNGLCSGQTSVLKTSWASLDSAAPGGAAEPTSYQCTLLISLPPIFIGVCISISFTILIYVCISISACFCIWLV